MSSVNEMSTVNKLLNFGCCIGMSDSNGVSLVNRFVVKPIDWMTANDGTNKVAQFLWREIMARIWAATTPVFALLTAAYHVMAIMVKTPFGTLMTAGIKQIPDTFSFRAIRENCLNMGQAFLLTAAGISAVVRPEKLAEYAYPISEKKKVPIFGYHELSKKIEDPWTVSPAQFRSHLQHLYDHNYELCTLKELAEGHQPSPGKKLAVITFDDSHESQFRINGGSVDPDCAVGILEKFNYEHPKFRCAATFFVNTSTNPGSSGQKKHRLFEKHPDQKKHTINKLRFLQPAKPGYPAYEIASHGHLHQRFDKMSESDVHLDLLSFEEEFTELGINHDRIRSFAWPHGMSSKGKARKVIEDRFDNIADFGFHSGKEDPSRMNRRRIRRLYIGPNTGFKQYAP